MRRSTKRTATPPGRSRSPRRAGRCRCARASARSRSRSCHLYELAALVDRVPRQRLQALADVSNREPRALAVVVRDGHGSTSACAYTRAKAGSGDDGVFAGRIDPRVVAAAADPRAVAAAADLRAVAAGADTRAVAAGADPRAVAAAADLRVVAAAADPR